MVFGIHLSYEKWYPGAFFSCEQALAKWKSPAVYHSLLVDLLRRYTSFSHSIKVITLPTWHLLSDFQISRFFKQIKHIHNVKIIVNIQKYFKKSVLSSDSSIVLFLCDFITSCNTTTQNCPRSFLSWPGKACPIVAYITVGHGPVPYVAYSTNKKESAWFLWLLY